MPRNQSLGSFGTDGGFLSGASGQPFSFFSELAAPLLDIPLRLALLGWAWDLHLLFGFHGRRRVGALALVFPVAGQLSSAVEALSVCDGCLHMRAQD